MGYDFELDDSASVVHPMHGAEGLTLSIDGQNVRVALRPTENDGQFILELDGHHEPVSAARRGDVHFIHFRGRTHRVNAINALERAEREAAPTGGEEFLRAPMPGVVVEVVVEQGAEVESGQPLMTIESMKLQTAIVAPHAARVAELFLTTGASFEQGTALVRLEALDREADDESGDGKGESK
jgi:3-methylcrotonyl-CoA carboxylase alpha subunit